MRGDQNSSESPNGPAGEGEQAVDAADMFQVLADPARRRVLRELYETDGRVCLHEFTDRFADDGFADELAADADHLAIRLHHHYLPKLDDCGLADYDPASNTVVAEIPAWVEPYLDAVDE